MNFGTFSMHAACMLHEKLHAYNISVLKVASQKVSIRVHTQGWGRHIFWRQDIQNEYLYDILSIYTFSNMHQMTCYLHVICMWHACYYSHYMHSASYHYFNLHTTCILPLLQHACYLNMCHPWLHSCYRCVWENMLVKACNMNTNKWWMIVGSRHRHGRRRPWLGSKAAWLLIFQSYISTSLHSIGGGRQFV